MRIKIPSDDVSVLEMNDWIAELRDGGRAVPPGDDGRAGPTPEAAAASPANLLTASTGNGASGEPAPRAAIGDQLRIPIAWCEMSSCISHHADPAALGEADIRARAISAGWCLDRLGRLTCPNCQQSSPGFWASRPVELWDRNVAITRAYLMAAVLRNDAAAGGAEKAP